MGLWWVLVKTSYEHFVLMGLQTDISLLYRLATLQVHYVACSTVVYRFWCVENLYLPCNLNSAIPATSVAFLHNSSRATNPEGSFLLDAGKWAIPFYSLTLVTNGLSSGELRNSVHPISSIIATRSKQLCLSMAFGK